MESRRRPGRPAGLLQRPSHRPSGLGSGGTAVAVANFAFVPAALSVQTGDIVTWTNMEDVSHTVTAGNGAFDSGAFGHGMTFQLTAGAPGTYTYLCQIHPFMKGTLTVTP